MSERIQYQATVLPDQAGHRIDQIAAELFADFSRARLQEWIKSGHLTVNGVAVRGGMCGTQPPMSMPCNRKVAPTAQRAREGEA